MPARITVFGTPEQVVSSVLEVLDLSEADVAVRLATLPRPTARRLLVDRLARGGVGPAAEDRFLCAFRHLGTGAAGSRLQRIAMDLDRPPAMRRLAMATLGLADEDEALAAPEELQAALEENLAHLVRLTLVDGGAAMGLAGLLELLEPDMQAAMAGIAEGIRRDEGIPGPLVWAAALERPALGAIRADVLQALVEEGGPGAVHLLAALRDRASSVADRSQFQGALLRVCTAEADPDHSSAPVRGDAWVSSCDGQGDFNVMAALRRGREGRIFAALCVRAGGEVRDGFVVPDQAADEVPEFLREFAETSGVHFTPVPLALAASLVGEALALGAQKGRAPPKEAQASVALLQRAHGPVPDGPDAPLTPDGADYAAFLGHVAYTSWTVELADLGPDAPLPARRASPASREAWVVATAERLDTSPNRARLAASLGHMSRWHAWAGEPAVAAAAVAAAEAAATSIAGHPVVHGMLRRAWPRLRRERDLGCQPFGDPAVRARLRATWFADVPVPRGRDLALLDIAEVTLGLLGWLFASGKERPRPERLERVAMGVARAFEDALHGSLGRARRPATLCIAPMADELGALSGVDEKRAEALARELFAGLYGFYEGVCTRCPRRCHWRPNAAAGDAFFDEVHPALKAGL